MSKHLSIIFTLVLMAAACTVSRVDRYPGKAIDAFPEILQGEYRLTASGFKAFFKARQMDSVRIRISADKIETLEESGWSTAFKIGSEAVLSNKDNWYFVSRKDATEPNLWNTTILQTNGREILIHPLAASENNLQKDILKNYLQLNLLTRINKEEKIQSVNPTDIATLKTVSNLSDDRKDSVLYYTMNEDQLLLYINKELNSRNGIRFIKINTTK